MARRRAGGFSLLEILIVVAILALAGAVALPLLSSGDPVRVDVVAEEIAAALRHARDEALRTTEVHGVRVLAPPALVQVYKADLSGGGIAIDSVLPHPLSGQPYRFRIDQVPRAGRVEMRNLTPPFQYAGLGARQADVIFDAEGIPGFLTGGSWKRLVSGTVDLGYAGYERTVALAPIGRVLVQ